MTTYHRIIEDGIAWPEPLEDHRAAIELEIANALGCPDSAVVISRCSPLRTGQLEIEICIRTDTVEPSEWELAALAKVIG
jgi:hypothetical protein